MGTAWSSEPIAALSRSLNLKLHQLPQHSGFMDFAMGIFRLGRGFAIALLGTGLYPCIAHAGFFDFLFQQFQAPAVWPFEGRPGYMPRHADPGFYRRSFHKHKLSARRKVIVADQTDHPVRPHGPIDLMDDDSLQEGDAVMTQAGIRIFTGDSNSHHKPEDFRKLSEIKGLSKLERKALAAIDAPGSDTSASKGKHEMVTGRSITDATVVTGETITDPKGRSIRYVGP